MPKFMIIVKFEGEIWTDFKETYLDARNYMFTANSQGAYSELYERRPIDRKHPEIGNEYQLVEA